jgi:Tol biopolymer transport system component
MPMGKLRPYLATAVLVLLVSTAFAGSIRTPTIVWSSSRSGTLGIWAMNPDGTGQRQLTDDTGRDITPSISPDGRSIAFSSYRGGGLAELWVMNQDGSGLRRVASVPGLNVQWPTWSPDGGMLYFDAVAGASSGGLYSVRLDGTDLTRLLSGYAARPEVSPDGTEIWFDKRTSSLSYSHQLFKMDIDGTDVVQLTSGPSGEAYTKSCGLGRGEAGDGHAEGRAADVVEADLVAEVHRRRVAAVLAADAELEVLGGRRGPSRRPSRPAGRRRSGRATGTGRSRGCPST